MDLLHWLVVGIASIGAFVFVVLGSVVAWRWWLAIPLVGLWFKGLFGLCFGVGLDRLAIGVARLCIAVST